MKTTRPYARVGVRVCVCVRVSGVGRAEEGTKMTAIRDETLATTTPAVSVGPLSAPPAGPRAPALANICTE